MSSVSILNKTKTKIMDFLEHYKKDLTPKEKAIELFCKFKSLDIELKDTIEGNIFISMKHQDAKKCALISVDEIIELEDDINKVWFWNYWQEVKQEIEKL